MRPSVQKITACFGFIALFLFSNLQAQVLNDVRFSELPGNRFEVRMQFDSQPEEPTGYTIEQPARIVLDFTGVENQLEARKFPLSFENAKSAVVLSGEDRTRMILNLSQLASYSTRTEGSYFIVEVGSKQDESYLAASSSATKKLASEIDEHQSAITGIDFRRGEEGEGKVIVDLSDPSIDINVEQKSATINIEFIGAQLPNALRRNLDVTDFATPVTSVSSDYDGRKTTLAIDASGEYDYLAYQADNTYVISVKPLTEAEAEEKKARFSFVGEKLSLNFQNIEVRSVLQLIADFTELNLVASDTVGGSITLRLDNVPWDQALDLVLKTKGLDKRQIGNVLMVAPAAEIAERERQELETKRQLQELAPLVTEYVRIRYASAKELFKLFNENDGGGSGGGEGGSTSSILSERGSAIVDERTNSIILTDTAEKIDEFKKLIAKVDIPIRQVMIEARIVIANSDFRKELGVKWGGIGTQYGGDSATSFGGSHTSLSSNPNTPAQFFSPPFEFDDVNEDGEYQEGEPITSVEDVGTDIQDNLAVDLGVANPAGSLAMSFIDSNVFLTMEISALQDSGHAEIVSQPKVITGDKQKAHIESGTEIPFQEASSSGATTTSFKEAVLKLDVTPQITPDDQIIMDLKVNQDSVGEIVGDSDIPTIDVTELQTQVLVANGQTVVLGGIFQTNQVNGVTKVPFLGDLPYVGRMFRRDVQSENKRELLIFITPKILSNDLVK
ncbi:MAG: type IV pilus secretin PilQ [Cellvibrionaceae bacterium]